MSDGGGFRRLAICDFSEAGFVRERKDAGGGGIAPGLGRQARMCGGPGSGDAGQVRRRLAIAAANGGQDRSAAAKIGARDPQRLGDWVHRFNAEGLAGLIDRKPAGAAAEP
jgi:hypothetical protein